MGICVMYTLMFLPIAARSIMFIGAFGFGLLGLAPALSLPCIWASGKSVCHLSDQKKTYFNAHQVEHIGHLIVLVMVVAVELPSTLTRINLEQACKPVTQMQAIKWLRKYGSQEVLLRACYERSGRATDIVGSLYEAAHPISMSEARSVFYKVTGKTFNSVPIPESARATIKNSETMKDPSGLNAGVEDEFDLDTDIAGDSVSGFARGLSIASSSINGRYDANAAVATLNWSFSFANSSQYDREARAAILLPPGSVVTRAILKLNKIDHDATIQVREEARARYVEAVMQHKDDPLLVSTCGPDQILVQCYPVHPNCDMQVTLSIVSPLPLDKSGDANLMLPGFIEKNFKCDARVAVKIDPAVSNENSSISLAAKEEELTQSSFHIKRKHDCTSVCALDKFAAASDTFVEENIRKQEYKSPERLIILIDGSADLAGKTSALADSLKTLQGKIPLDLVLMTDEQTSLFAFPDKSKEHFEQAIEKIRKYQPVGGQDNSKALFEYLHVLSASESGAVLWIHGSQPIAGADASQIAALLKQERSAPLLYDYQIAPGPVEILKDIRANSSVCHPARRGSIQSDLSELFSSWADEPDKTPQFNITDAASENIDKESSEALLKLAAYNRLLEQLRASKTDNSGEACKIARDYHLVSPVSSAVVADDGQSFTAATPVKQKRFSLESSFVDFSEGMNYGFDQCISVLKYLNPLGWLAGCGSLSEHDSQSFSTTVNQLNRLNSVTNAQNSSKQSSETRSVSRIEYQSARDGSGAPPPSPAVSLTAAKDDSAKVVATGGSHLKKAAPPSSVPTASSSPQVAAECVRSNLLAYDEGQATAQYSAPDKISLPVIMSNAQKGQKRRDVDELSVNSPSRQVAEAAKPSEEAAVGVVEGAVNGSIGPQNTDAALIQGANTSGIVRLDKGENLDSQCESDELCSTDQVPEKKKSMHAEASMPSAKDRWVYYMDFCIVAAFAWFLFPKLRMRAASKFQKVLQK